MWALIVVISLLVFVGSLACFSFKSTRRKAKRYAWMSVLSMTIAGGFLASEQDNAAHRLGSSDTDEQRAATKVGVIDPAASHAAKEDNVRAPVANGRARVCATKDFTFDSYHEIKLPTKTVFRDSGPLTGDVRDPWRPENVSDNKGAAFITTDPVTLTKAKPCAESGVRMLVGKLFKEPSASASDRRVWEIDVVLEYSPTSGWTPVEFGKLIDDIGVRAELLTDADDALTLAKEELDEAAQAAKCLAEAQKVAAHERGVIGRQTGSVVFISNPAASEFSFGCGVDGLKPDILIA